MIGSPWTLVSMGERAWSAPRARSTSSRTAISSCSGSTYKSAEKNGIRPRRSTAVWADFSFRIVTGQLRRSGRVCRAMPKFFLVLFLIRKRTREKEPSRGCRRGPGGGRPGSHRAPGSAGSLPGTCPCPPRSSSLRAHTSPPHG